MGGRESETNGVGPVFHTHAWEGQTVHTHTHTHTQVVKVLVVYCPGQQCTSLAKSGAISPLVATKSSATGVKGVTGGVAPYLAIPCPAFPSILPPFHPSTTPLHTFALLPNPRRVTRGSLSRSAGEGRKEGRKKEESVISGYNR